MGFPAAFFLCEPSPCIAWSADCDCDYDCDYQPPQLLLLVLVNSTGWADCLPENAFFSHNRTRSLPTAGWWSRCHAPRWVSYKRPATPPTWHSPPTAGGVGATPGTAFCTFIERVFQVSSNLAAIEWLFEGASTIRHASLSGGAASLHSLRFSAAWWLVSNAANG